MNQEHIIEAVRSGIVEMRKTPAAFLFVDETPGIDWTWDLPLIHDVPVYHVREVSCYRWGACSSSVPFIPLGLDDAEISSRDRKRFAEAYDNYMYTLWNTPTNTQRSPAGTGRGTSSCTQPA
jgi:hypothetical protein